MPGRTPKPAASAPRCAGCRNFANDAPELERRLPGLITLSSAYAAVRAADGLCRVHDRYVAASSHCAAWQAREGPQALE